MSDELKLERVIFNECGEGIISVMLGAVLTIIMLAMGLSIADRTMNDTKVTKYTEDIYWVVNRSQSLKRTTNNYIGAVAVLPSPAIPPMSNTVLIASTELPSGIASGVSVLTHSFNGSITVSPAVNITPTLSVVATNIPNKLCIDIAIQSSSKLVPMGLSLLTINAIPITFSPFNLASVKTACGFGVSSISYEVQ